MDFNQVKYFLALAETLNFTRAAEECHVSQPALTQGIKRLEDELGGPLITREGRYTQLTVLGQSLHTHFEQINRTRHLVSKTAKDVISEKWNVTRNHRNLHKHVVVIKNHDMVIRQFEFFAMSGMIANGQPR